MTEKEIRDRIQAGRDFMKFYAEDESSDFQSDQEKKLPQPPLVKEPAGGQVKDLPRDFESLQMNRNLTELLTTRCSHRVYSEETMSLLQLSFLLWATQGVKEIRGKRYATLRTVPSGGARHGFETYLLVKNVDGLAPGAYHYLPMTHSLEFLGEVPDYSETVSETLVGQKWAAKANVIFYWSFVPYRCEWRYGIYAHRVALIDAGHLGENLYLACESAGLGTCAIGAFDDKSCNQLFSLDGEEEFVVYTAPVGTVAVDDRKKEKDFYRFVDEQGL